MKEGGEEREGEKDWKKEVEMEEAETEREKKKEER